MTNRVNIRRNLLQAFIVSATLAGIVLAAVVLISGCTSDKADDSDGPGKNPPSSLFGPPPTAAQQAANWPMFRGPTGQGQGGDQVVPSFDAGSGRGMLWKAEVPLPGMNSPVVWGNRVFVTGADKQTRIVFCFSADSGQLLWSADVSNPQSPPSPNVMEEYTGYAAPTAATDGRAVYAIFANGDIAAISMAGERLWARSLGVPDNVYGHASSLLTYGDLLIVQYDQGHAEEGLSRLLALNCGTGETVWSQARPVSQSWATPVVLSTAAGDQLLTAASPYVIAYDPVSGREIWRADVIYGDVALTPIYTSALVFAATPDLSLFAIRPDGRGDVTATHVAWESSEGVPDITSPAGDGQRLLMITTHGHLTCHNAADGKLLWEHYFDGEDFYGSPIVAAGQFYLLSHAGRLFQVDSADEPEIRLLGELGEKTYCSPALVAGRLYVRGVKHLYGIGPDAAP